MVCLLLGWDLLHTIELYIKISFVCFFLKTLVYYIKMEKYRTPPPPTHTRTHTHTYAARDYEWHVLRVLRYAQCIIEKNSRLQQNFYISRSSYGSRIRSHRSDGVAVVSRPINLPLSSTITPHWFPRDFPSTIIFHRILNKKMSKLFFCRKLPFTTSLPLPLRRVGILVTRYHHRSTVIN